MSTSNTIVWVGSTVATITSSERRLEICAVQDIVEKIVPGLKKFKFGFYRLLGLVYYGLLEFVALFAIIGSISCDYTDPTVRVFILFVIFAVGILRFALPKVYNNVVKTLNITLE